MKRDRFALYGIDMESSWLDVMPKDVTNEIAHQLARSLREDIHTELRAELLQELPGDGVWVDNPTLYHRLALDVQCCLKQMSQRELYFITHWVGTLELDIFERLGLESVLGAWRQQLQLTYILSHEKKETNAPTYYCMSFINMLPYQTLLDLKRLLNGRG